MLGKRLIRLKSQAGLRALQMNFAIMPETSKTAKARLRKQKVANGNDRTV